MDRGKVLEMRRGNKESRTITLSREMHAYIETEAREHHRPFSWQIELMLHTARTVMEGAVVTVDVDDLSDPTGRRS